MPSASRPTAEVSYAEID